MNPADQAAGALRHALLLVLGASLFVQGGTLVVPLYDMHLFDTVLRSHSTETLVALSLACLVGLALYALLSWLRAAVLAIAAQRLGAELTDPVLRAGLALSLRGDPRAGAEALRDLSALRAALAGPTATVPFDLLWSPLLLAVLFLMHPAIGWLGVAACGVQLAMAIAVDRAAGAPLQRAQALHEAAVHQAGGLLQDRALASGLGMEPAMRRRFFRQAQAAARAQDAAHARAERIGAAARAVRHASQGLLIALGALLVLRHEASPGVLVGANLLFAMLLAPLDQAIASWRQVVGARLAWRRLRALLAAAPPAPANDDAPSAADAQPGLVVQDLAFEAEGRSLLGPVSLRVAPGSFTLVTGPSGAGKSTLLRLLAGVLAPTGGNAMLDGTRLARIDRARLVGYLPARLHLLHGTVFETIARHREADAADVVAAATRAGLHAAIGRLPDGYATRIDPHTPLLSGGQKQRLALARALFGRPRLLLLDEPDANLDHEGEQALRAAILQARQDGTVILAVSHRPGLAAIADQVLVLEAGRVARRTEANTLQAAG